jgi:uncharacterized DUF497 family protein
MKWLSYNSTMSDFRRLRWNPGNIAHIARHGVSRMEVEEVFEGDFITQLSYGGRRIVIGATASGRVLSVIIEDEADDVSFVVTARSASRRERRLFRSAQEGLQE